MTTSRGKIAIPTKVMSRHVSLKYEDESEQSSDEHERSLSADCVTNSTTASPMGPPNVEADEEAPRPTVRVKSDQADLNPESNERPREARQSFSGDPALGEDDQCSVSSSPKQWDKYGFSIERGQAARFIASPVRTPSAERNLSKVWSKYLDQLSSYGRIFRTRELRLLVRSGVPPAFRGHLWKAFARSSELRGDHPPHYYESLISSSAFNTPTTATAEIDKDVRRTFPGHRLFRTEPALKALRRVLVAYSIHNPQVGYCQSLNFLCGILLLFVDEEDAFWLLEAVAARVLAGYYAPGLKACLVDQVDIYNFTLHSGLFLASLAGYYAPGLKACLVDQVDIYTGIEIVHLCSLFWTEKPTDYFKVTCYWPTWRDTNASGLKALSPRSG